jgi:hypothetical protein
VVYILHHVGTPHHCIIQETRSCVLVLVMAHARTALSVLATHHAYMYTRTYPSYIYAGKYIYVYIHMHTCCTVPAPCIEREIDGAHVQYVLTHKHCTAQWQIKQ